ncbi:MAG: Ig-like domain-containing protein [candidate division Zixibacteria bacterium]
MKKTSFKFIVAFYLSLSISCAVKERPSGGPEDKTPPTVVLIEPESGNINIPPDTEFKITFSKPMEHYKTEKAIFLTPVFWEYPRMKWKGKTLTVIPPRNLDSAKTYVITIGADAEGYHRNKMGKSYSFAFSTGDKIDSCSVGGVVFAQGRGRTVYDIWAYPLVDTQNVDFLRHIPEFATQIDSMGRFAISNMRAGNYLVLAIDDKNSDLFWEPGTETIGLPPFIINLRDGESYYDLVLRPLRRDTLTAYVSRAKSINNRRVDIEFSQPLSNEAYLNPAFFNITARKDSTVLDIEDMYSIEEGKLVVETSEQIDGEDYRITPLGLASDWGIVFDTSGIGFTGNGQPDTTGPRLISTAPGGRSVMSFQDSVVQLTFSERINPSGFSNAVTVVADSVDTLIFNPLLSQPFIVHLRFPDRIPREKRIEVILEPDSVLDINGNSIPDSILSFTFRLPPSDTVGIVAAITEPNTKIKGILTSSARNGPIYESYADPAGNLIFDTVIPGNYRVEYFDDSDSNGVWSSGIIDPFHPSERFSFLPDSIFVRSRWTTEIGKLELPAHD